MKENVISCHTIMRQFNFISMLSGILSCYYVFISSSTKIINIKKRLIWILDIKVKEMKVSKWWAYDVRLYYVMQYIFVCHISKASFNTKKFLCLVGFCTKRMMIFSSDLYIRGNHVQKIHLSAPAVSICMFLMYLDVTSNFSSSRKTL